MTAVTLQPSDTAIDAAIQLNGAGVRFDFDSRGRVLTPTLKRLRRTRSTAWGFRGVDLDLKSGGGLGIIGPTGSGKTTLLRVLAGVMDVDEGEARLRGRVGALLATEVGLQAMLTGREAALLLSVLAGTPLARARAELESVKALTRLEDAFERPVYTYSQGMRARLHLAVIVATDPEVLLLDEVFEALDHEFRGVVERFANQLRARGGIVVAAGHDHEALERLCPEALLLDRGTVAARGPFGDVAAAYRSA